MSPMKRFVLIFTIFAFAAGACTPTQTPSTVPPTQLPTVLTPTASPPPTYTLTATLPSQVTIYPTATPKKTATPANTSTPVPTSTPYGPLSASGPHLAYVVETTGGGRALTFLNADASGREIIPIPADAILSSLNSALSPNGEWLAFHIGSAGKNEEWGKVDLTGPLDLTLKLMHLPDGKITTVTSLLSKDYPANLDKHAAFLIQTDPGWSYIDLETAKVLVAEIFIWGMHGMDWSPDSRYLAFSGEMDGPTSDLYMYDTQNALINRLTDGPSEMTGFISWSADGKWILHGSSNDTPGEGMTSDLYVVRPDGTGAKKIDVSNGNSGYWVSPISYEIYDRANVSGNHNLRMINVETGEVKTIWRDSFDGYAFDPNTGSFVICGGGFLDRDQQPQGIYLFLPDKPLQYISTAPCDIIYRGTPAHPFLAADLYSDHGLSFISGNGKLTPSTLNGRVVDISPDYRWMLLTEDESNLKLFNENDALIRELVPLLPDVIFFRMDSAGIYYKVGTSLFYMRIPDGEAVMVDENLSTDGNKYDINYRWIINRNNH